MSALKFVCLVAALCCLYSINGLSMVKPGRCTKPKTCDVCKHVEWLEMACSVRTREMACSETTSVSKEMIAENICCPPGEKLDKEKMNCAKASVDELVDDIVRSVESTKVFSSLEVAAKGEFLRIAKKLSSNLHKENDAMDVEIMEKVKTELITLLENDWKTIVDSSCADPSDDSKKICDLAERAKEKFRKTIEGDGGDEECGPNQQFDLTMLKCIDKDIVNIGLEILATMKEEGQTLDDDTTKSISGSVSAGLALVLKAIKDGHSNVDALDTLKNQAVVVTRQITELCTNPDEMKIPYCKLINDISKWFDQMINKKTPCKEGQVFHEKMTRAEIQCLDLDFTSFIKHMIRSNLAESAIDPKSFEGKIMSGVTKAIANYQAASEDNTRTTKQRQDDLVKGLQITVQETMATMPDLCPPYQQQGTAETGENADDEKAKELESKACQFGTKVLKELGNAANEQNSCIHGQIFDFSLLKCIDVMVVDFGIEILQQLDSLVDPAAEEASMVGKLKASLTKVMQKFKEQTIKAGAETKQQRLDEFVNTLKAEIKVMIATAYPQCPVQNIDQTTGKFEEIVVDEACKTVHNIAKYYMRLLGDTGATSCPAGKIFDVGILSCADMHIVDYAGKLLGLLKSKGMLKNITDPSESTLITNMVNSLQAFITKAKSVALTTDLSEVKLEKMKTNGRDEMVGYLRSLDKLCMTLQNPVCPKALKLGEHIAQFVFDKLFTEGCGLHEFFDLSILKCVKAEVYDSVKELLDSFKVLKAEHVTEQVIKENVIQIAKAFVNNVKDQAGSQEPIDVFMAVGKGLQLEVKSILNTANELCKDAKTEDEGGDFIEFQMCSLIRNVARSLAAISDKSILPVTTSTVAVPKHCARWDESILDCLDNHFVSVLYQFVKKIQSLDDGLLSSTTTQGRLFELLNRVLREWQRKDIEQGLPAKELFKQFVNSNDNGLKVIMEHMKGMCELIPEEDQDQDQDPDQVPGQDQDQVPDQDQDQDRDQQQQQQQGENDEKRIIRMICSSWVEMGGNFAFNLITGGDDSLDNGGKCARGQILDIELLKCVDVVFLDMAMKMMNELKNNRDVTVPGTFENKVADSMETFMAALLKEAQNMDKKVSQKQEDLFKNINVEVDNMMRSMKDYCKQHINDQGASFEYKMCSMMTQMAEQITKVNLEMAEGDIVDFIDGSLDHIKESSGNQILKRDIIVMLEKLQLNLMEIHDKQAETSGDKKLELLDQENIELVGKTIHDMCQDDPQADTCVKISENYEKFLSVVNKVCENEFEVLNKTSMKCSAPDSLHSFFAGILPSLDKLTAISDINVKAIHKQLFVLVREVMGALQREEGNMDYGELLAPFEGKWNAILVMRENSCEDIRNKGDQEKMVCKLLEQIEKTVNKKLGLDDSEEKMCDFLRAEAGMKKCGDDEHYCIDGNRCESNDVPCDMFNGKMAAMTTDEPQILCSAFDDVCKRDEHLMKLREQCNSLQERPVYVNVALKEGQKIRSAVLDKLGQDIIGYLGLDENEDPDKWDFICERDDDKEYLEKMKEISSKETSITGAVDSGVIDGVSGIKEATTVVEEKRPNLLECLIKPRNREAGSCVMHKLTLKGRTKDGKHPLFVTLLFGSTKYQKPFDGDMITNNVQKRELATISRQRIDPETFEVPFKIPPVRMQCGEVLDEYEKCDKLDVYAVDCQGEGYFGMDTPDGEKLAHFSCEKVKQAMTESYVRVGYQSKIGMLPKPGSTEGAKLSLAYWCVKDINEDMRKVAPITLDDDSISKMEFVVEMGRPTFDDVTGVAYAKPVNVMDKTKNNGFTVHELLSNDAIKYRAGKFIDKVDGVKTAIKSKIATFANGYEKFKNPGILITQLEIPASIGRLMYKCTETSDFKDINMNTNSVFALTQKCRLKLEPKEVRTAASRKRRATEAPSPSNWKENDAKFHIKLVTDMENIQVGAHDDLDMSGDKFSKESRPVVLLGLGCDGDIGGELKDDGCGVCSKEKKVCDQCVAEETTDFLSLMKREINQCCTGVFCAKEMTCYATENSAPKDCAGVSCGDAIKECGQCVSGTPDEKRQRLQEMKDACGNCKSEQKTCDENALRIVEVRPLKLQGGGFSRISVCLNKESAVTNCQLISTVGSCPLETKAPSDMKLSTDPVCNARNSRKECIDLYTTPNCLVGTDYILKCNDLKFDDTNIEIGDRLEISINNTAQVLEVGRNMVDIKLSGITADSHYRCCWKDSDNNGQCSERKSSLKDLFICAIDVTDSNALSVYLRDCNGRKSNEVNLQISCKDATTKVKQVKRKGNDYFVIHFDKPVAKPNHDECKEFDTITNMKWTVLTSIQKLPKKCFMCDSKASGDVNLTPEPKKELACENRNRDIAMSLACTTKKKRNFFLRPTKSYTKGVSWNVEFGSDTINGDQEHLNVLKTKIGSTIKSNGLLPLEEGDFMEGMHYVFSFSGKNDQGTECSHDTNIRINQANTDYTVQMKSKARSLNVQLKDNCGKRVGFTSISWIDEADEVISTRKSLFLPSLRTYVDQELIVKAVIEYKKVNGEIAQMITDFITRELPAKELKLELEDGRKEKTLDCDKTGVIKKRLDVSKIGSAEVSWQCMQGDEACLDPDGVQILFKQRKNGHLNIDTPKMICGAVYNFTMYLQVGEKEVVDSIDIITKKMSKQPKVRCREIREIQGKDYYRWRCGVLYANEDQVEVYNMIEEHDDAQDFDTKYLEVTKKKTKKGVRLDIKIKKEGLSFNSSYRFTVGAMNDEGLDEMSTVITTGSGPPRDCEFEVTPLEGSSMTDTFTVAASGCISDSDAPIFYRVIIDYGTRDNGKRKEERQGTTSKEVIFSGVLSESLRNDSTVIFHIVAMADGQQSVQKLSVKVIPGNVPPMEVMTETVGEASQSIADGDPNAAFTSITSSVLYSKEKSNGTDDDSSGLEDQFSDWTYEGSQLEGADRNLAASTFGALVQKKSDNEIVSDDKKKSTTFFLIDAGISKPEFPEFEDEETGKRRRRSVVESNDEYTWMSTSMIESMLGVYEDILFPIMYSETDQLSKDVFHGFVKNSKRSLCENSESELIGSMNTSNLALHVREVVTIPDNLTVALPLGSTFKFSSDLKEKYEEWDCSIDGDVCNGFYVTSVEMKGDLLTNHSSSILTSVSTVVSLDLVNSLDTSNYAFIDDTSLTTEITLPLTNTESTDNIICHVWGGDSWVNGGCITTMNLATSSVTCKCPSAVGFYIGAFKAAVEYAIEVQSQFTTTEGPTTPTTTTTTTPPTPTPVTIKTPAKFSFAGEYNDVVSEMGGESNARDTICTGVRYALKLKSSEFENCTISSGSVVVSFDIVQSAAETAQTQQLLQQTVEADAFTMKTLDGTRLQTQQDSVTVGDNASDGGQGKEEKDENVMIIIIGVATFIILLIIVVIIIVVCQTKKNQQVHDSKEAAKQKQKEAAFSNESPKPQMYHEPLHESEMYQQPEEYESERYQPEPYQPEPYQIPTQEPYQMQTQEPYQMLTQGGPREEPAISNPAYEGDDYMNQFHQTEEYPPVMF